MLSSDLSGFRHGQKGASFAYKLMALVRSDSQGSTNPIQFSSKDGPVEILNHFLACVDGETQELAGTHELLHDGVSLPPFRELGPTQAQGRRSDRDGSSTLPPQHVQQLPPIPPKAVQPPKAAKRKQVQQAPTWDRATPTASAFCPDFNRGMCDSWYSCDNGLHKCSKLIREGNQTRFCGSATHGAHKCATPGRGSGGAAGAPPRENTDRNWHQPNSARLEVTQAEPWASSEATTEDNQDSEPYMVDIMSGPNYPLAKAFQMAGWRTFAVDLLFGKDHDLSKLENQEVIRKRLKGADFIWAALDCSDKSRI